MHAPTCGRIARSYSFATATGASAAAPDPIAYGIKHARIVCTADCWYSVTPTSVPASVGSTSVFLPAGYVEVLEVSPEDTFTAIAATAAGTFNISEVTR